MGEKWQTGSVIALAVAVLLVGFVPTAAAQATTSVVIDGTGVRDGDTVTVTDDPTVEIDIEANESIQSVSVRIDGETRRSFEPDESTFSERFTLDLEDGDHEMVVVAEDADVDLTVTIEKDSNSPLVTYVSPFESDGYPTNGEVVINRGNTTLAAELYDQSEISSVRIERRYRWTFAGGGDQTRETYRIENPGDNVTQPLLFGLGENDLRVEAIDEHGQRRTHDITVRVVDIRKPSIDLDRFDRSADGELTVAGTVSDEVKVNSLRYRFKSTSQEYFVLNPTSKEPTRERMNADFEFTVDPPADADSITLVATDVAGNTRRWEVPFDYREHLVPTVTFDADATRVTGDEITVVGRVADGRVNRIVIESIGPDGDTVDTATVYDGDATSSVSVRGRVGAASGETTVVIRAVDTADRTHRASLTLATPVRTAEPSTAAPTPTAALTQSPPSATATAPRTTATPTPAATTGAGGAGGDSGGDGREETERDGEEPSTVLLAVGLVVVVVGAVFGVDILIAVVSRIVNAITGLRLWDRWPPR